ncbi:hypothetical protein F4821DRAFT_263343 [Hypoxylon rubiginosum]|uniref:Uncharacterized protein n=1 Tax=Hypoxylon rubiginosum TaxID=110542 RepID=A0ACC0CRS5_9PEZI|nr:hypothetical protein F4821DRAFT_263343 [Hypoxylon rubiginosum]
MKINNAVLITSIALFIKFALVFGRVLDTKDLGIVNVEDVGLVTRGKGKPTKQPGSGSGSSSSKKKSTLKKGDSSKAEGELSGWGLVRTRGLTSKDAPMPYGYDDGENEYATIFKGSEWQGAVISPDEAHTQQYGADKVYEYYTNVNKQSFHTENVFTTETSNGQPRDLPANRRALTYNSWVEAEGDPANLRRFSDENIQNADAKRAFEAAFRAKGLDIDELDQSTVIRVSDPEWGQWDDGRNPFPRGYASMTIDYPGMQSRVVDVRLYVDISGDYHTIHNLEAVPDLQSKLRVRAEYFRRWAMTDRLANPLFAGE